MQGCDNGGVTSGETGEGLQIKGYLASAKFSNWTMSDFSNGESAGGEFVGRAWVEGHTNFIGDVGGKDVDFCGVNQGVARSGNGVEGGAKSGSSESRDRHGRHCGKLSGNDGGKGLLLAEVCAMMV